MCEERARVVADCARGSQGAHYRYRSARASVCWGVWDAGHDATIRCGAIPWGAIRHTEVGGGSRSIGAALAPKQAALVAGSLAYQGSEVVITSTSSSSSTSVTLASVICGQQLHGMQQQAVVFRQGGPIRSRHGLYCSSSSRFERLNVLVLPELRDSQDPVLNHP